MGFDQNSNRPLVVFRKWTTKINLGIAAGVLVFLCAGILLIIYRTRTSPADDPGAKVIPDVNPTVP